MKKIRLRFSRFLQRTGHRMTAGQMMIMGFGAAILLGGFLLSMPVCNANGRWLAFEDALFTSCSAVCVTGLVTIVPASQFTAAGKALLLILIQLGGFGIIACTMGAFLILKKQITMRSRVIIRQGYDQNTMSGLVVMLRFIIRGTFLIEGLGALGYALQFVPEYGLPKGIWYAIFHSVSAFCNAGIDILGDNSLQDYAANPLFNTVTVLLIIVSGLGFPVWKDLVQVVKCVWRRDCSIERALKKIRLQSRIVLIMTLILVFGGMAGVLLMEWSNPETLKSMNTVEKCMAALFQSVTTRTAGFFTIPQNQFREETRMFSCILMFIGGSPGGTAGGIKTTTAALLLVSCWSVLKGKEDTECFRRKIPYANIRTAFSVFTISFLAVLSGTLILLVLEPVTMTEALYEVVSAVATVGLTTGITPSLSTAGKMVIILLMYLGRLSPVTMALMFASKIGKKKSKIKLPEERIMVG